MYTCRDISNRPMTVLTAADETVAAVAEICRHLNARAWLFGLQAHGLSHNGSDIDIAVQSNDFSLIEEQVDELDTIYRIDLVDLNCPHEKGIENALIGIA